MTLDAVPAWPYNVRARVRHAVKGGVLLGSRDMRGVFCCAVILAGCFAEVAKHPGAGVIDAAAVSTDSDTDDPADQDSTSLDTGDAAAPATAALVACTPGALCDNGLPCLDTADGSYCASLCVASCPAGWHCQTSSVGSDVVSMCVPRWVTQCDPCNTHDDCKAFDPLSLCLAADETDLSLGKFCASSCAGDHACGAGMACSDVKNPGDGGVVKLCQPSDGVCPCSPRARQKSLSTPCSLANPAGSCAAVRACGPDGLSGCTAPLPAKEKCNGLDDDCNGKIDDGICDDNAPCTSDSCDVKGGGCVFKAIGDGAPCEDGSACTVADTCKSGVCSGVSKSCDDGKSCTIDACDPKTANCLNVPAGATPCDDGDACTSGDVCAAGTCSGGAATCDDGQSCTTDSCSAAEGCTHVAAAGATCADGNACTVGDACALDGIGGWLCLPGSQSAACDDANVCTDDACDPQSGCKNTDNSVALPCWTGPPGAAGVGACHGGIQVCAGGKPAGTCVGEVLPAASESCNGLDDDCNGTTDQGCKATVARVGTAWLRGSVVEGKQPGVRWGSGGGAHGQAGTDKYKAEFGLLRWLLGGGK